MGRIVVARRRSVPKATRSSLLLMIGGGWVLLSLLLPAARSFSSQSHRSFRTGLDRQKSREPLLPRKEGPPVSCWDPFSDSSTRTRTRTRSRSRSRTRSENLNLLNPVTSLNMHTTSTSTSTSTSKKNTRGLSYRKTDFEDAHESLSSDRGFANDSRAHETAHGFSSGDTDTRRTFRSSMQHGWIGLKELFSFPTSAVNTATVTAKRRSRGSSRSSSSRSSSSSSSRSNGESIELGSAGDGGETAVAVFEGLPLARTRKSTAWTPSPMVIQPKRLLSSPSSSSSSSSSSVLREIVEHNRSWIQLQIVKHGAVVFRGFDLWKSDSGSDTIREIARMLEHSISNQSRNGGFQTYLVVSSPKKQEGYPQPNRSKDSSPSNERCWEEIGTDARITDFRAVHRDLPTDLGAKLTAKKLLYTRIDAAVDTPASDPYRFRRSNGDNDNDNDHDNDNDNDNDSARGWSQLFGTTNTKSFERVYRRFRGAGAAGTRLSEFEFESEAFLPHPITHEKLWFPLAHTYHWASAPAQLWDEFLRTKKVSTLGRALRMGARSLWRHGIQGKSTTPVDVAYGDGTPISVGEMRRILRTIRSNTSTARDWFRVGDLWIVDGWSAGVQWN